MAQNDSGKPVSGSKRNPKLLPGKQDQESQKRCLKTKGGYKKENGLLERTRKWTEKAKRDFIVSLQRFNGKASVGSKSTPFLFSLSSDCRIL
jgi:hypothetical protein